MPPAQSARSRSTLALIIRGALLIGLAGCGGAPRVPEPQVGRVTTPLPRIEPALIAIPVTISLGAIRARLDSVFPAADSLDQARCVALGGTVCHQYVYRREPLEVAMRDDRFTVGARLRYRGRVALPRMGGLGSCGYAPESMRRANLSFATSLYWRADWRLGSRATELTADLVDSCTVTMLAMDATPYMRRMAEGQLAALRREVDSIIPALVDLRPAADSLWRLLQQPMALDSAGDAWLTMGTESVGLAPVTGVDGAIHTTVVLTARPHVVLGARPGAGSRSLPTLTLAPRASGLRIPVDVSLPFDELGRRATTVLAGEGAGKGLTVREVRVWGAAGTAVVRVDVAGRVDGTFYLVGRVGYDPAARAMKVDGLRYTVESRGLMSRLKVTLGAPLIRRALDDATSHGELDLGAQLDSVRHTLTSQLNRRLGPGISVGGGVREVRVDGIHTTPTSFVVRVTLLGEAQLFVQ